MPRNTQPAQIDRHVGQRIRMRRMMRSMSQEKLADELGLSFQQVQKYEKGTNRVSAGRLVQIANVLVVPVTFFFDGAPGYGEHKNTSKLEGQFFALQGAAELAGHFVDVTNPADRRALINIASSLAGHTLAKAAE